MKKLITVFLLVCMLASFCTVNAFADGAVAKVNDVEYSTLQEAIDNANGNPVVLLAPITITGTETIDLKGQTVSYEQTSNATSNTQMILNKGNLTITDSLGGGKLTYTYSGADLGTSYAANTITSDPGSVLTVSGGTIENLTYNSAVIAYAIDGRTNGGLGDVTVNIYGGTVRSERQAIRIFANSTSNIGKLNIYSGGIVGRVIIQNANANANRAALYIQNGTFYPNSYKPDVLALCASNGEHIDMDVSIVGGTYEGEISKTAPNTGFISGGTFKNSINEADIAPGFEIKQNSNGSYTVEEPKFDLQEAVDSSNGAAITLPGDVVIEEPIKVPANTAIKMELSDSTFDNDLTAASGVDSIFTLEKGASVTITNVEGTDAELKQMRELVDDDYCVSKGSIIIKDSHNMNGSTCVDCGASSSSAYVPATADNSHMILWSVLFVVFAATVIVTGKKRSVA